MAILTMNYPDIVSDFAGFGGGIEWLVPLDNSHEIRIGSVKDLDISGVNPTANHDAASAKTYDLFDLSDKVSVQADFWYNNSDPDYPDMLEGAFYIKNKVNNQRKNTYQSYPTGSAYSKKGIINLDFNAYAGAGKFCYARKNIIDTYKIRIVLVTEYYDNLLNPNGFGIVALFPSYNTQYPASLQSWAHVNTGFMGGANGLMFDYNNPDASDIFYPFRGNGYAVLWISDIDHFNNFVKGYDPDYDVNNNITIGNYEEDPIQEIDPSTPGGGGGSYNPGSDPIDFPELPTGGALASGACKAYLMEPANIKTIFNKLWSTNVFDLDTFQKIVENPIDAIISLHALPVTPLTSASNAVYIGNFDTETNGLSIGSQYLTIDCGSLKIPEFWGSALDYSPYTKVELYLPFIGIQKLNVDDIINKTTHIKYNVDVLTGDCIANVKCGNSTLYKYHGNMKMEIPATASSNNAMLKGLQSTLSMAGTAIAGAAVGGGAGALVGAGLSAASNVTGSKTTVSRSGNISGSTSLLDDFTPFFIVHRPIQSLAKDYNKEKGYTSNISAILSSLSGYTEVEYIHLDNISATDAELNEIERLLKGGVII